MAEYQFKRALQVHCLDQHRALLSVRCFRGSAFHVEWLAPPGLELWQLCIEGVPLIACCSLSHDGSQMLSHCTCAAVLQLGCTLPASMACVGLLQLEGLPDCSGLLQVNPQSSVLRCYAGMALHKMGRTQEALQQLQVGMLKWHWLAKPCQKVLRCNPV